MTLQQLKQVIAIADCGSMNEAARQLFVTQPSLSTTVRELEKELGITIFLRSNRGIKITPDGGEFLRYARQVIEQCAVIEQRYIGHARKQKFSVSTQHYSFAVKAFVELVKEFGMDDYAFALHETKTAEVISNVREFESEIGLIYLSESNKVIMQKLLHEYELSFTPLICCDSYVYLYKEHPLAALEKIGMDQLLPYPCIAFEQGSGHSYHFAEEMKSTYAYPKLIKVDDRATALNLMVGLDAYTLCSGIICEELNGNDHLAIPLIESEAMTIGILSRSAVPFSPLATRYIDKLKAYLTHNRLL